MAVATATKQWTLDELHRLPDDGNRYELVHGELLVTPAPSYLHQTVVARLHAELVPYVHRHALGDVHTARSVVRRNASEVEPDLFVCARAARVRDDWEKVPTPLLVVEVLSPFTRRRDRHLKRFFYLDTVKVSEYWVVDPDTRVAIIARPGFDDVVADAKLTWLPERSSEPLSIDVQALFAD